MEQRTIRWAEAWLAGYWLLTSAILLLGPHPSAAGIHLAMWQLLAAAFLYMLSTWCERHPSASFLFWLPWSPLFLWTYGNIDYVHKTLGWPYQDGLVRGWEHAIWRSIDPAMDWSRAWPWLWFSESIHVCYLTYYAMVPLLLIRVWRAGGSSRTLRLILTGGVSSLVACYTVNIFFPVQGPRPLYGPLADVLHGPVWTFCHSLLKKAAAGAAAFPSGHTSYSVTAAIMAWRWDRKWFPLYGLWAAGVVSATIYGRFHYSVDVLAGIVLASCCAGAVILGGDGGESNP